MRSWRYAAAMAAVVLAACAGEGGPAGDDAEDPGPVADADAIDPDAPADGDAGEGANDEGAGEASEALAPCTSAAGCGLGYCVAAPSGGDVCAAGCGDSPCPSGWTCRTVVNPQNDLIRLCLAGPGTPCRPCAADADCRPADASTRDRCLDAGPGLGSFCATDCDDAACGDGLSCREATDATGGPVRLCAPASGACECPADAIAKGLTTPCEVANLQGTCGGVRRCTEDGLTACDADTPERETCRNKADDDCDGATDEEDCQDCVVYYFDGDGDGYGVQGKSRCLSAPDGPYSAEHYGDCDDGEVKVSPARVEGCNGIDDDCDGQTDEEGAAGCKKLHLDNDQDGHGSLAGERCLCEKTGKYTAATADDCNDSDGAIGPQAEEKCDGIDNDCDGVTDEAGAKLCSVRYYDADGDGHGTSQTKCVCMGDPKYRADLGDDCDDTNDEVHPGADEVCDNGLDDDCDGAKDEALPNCKTCVPYYWDLDWDGYGVTTKWQCLKESMSPYTTKVPGDCADGDPAINPGKPEKCNGMDDDCDGLTDEEGALGCKILFLDADQDGAGVTGSTRCLCAAADGYSATTGGDCDDNDPQRSPGIPETCNGLDDDCDGDVDEEGAGGCTTYYFDEDGDGKGVTDLAHCFCAPAGKFRGTEPGDCNDADPAVHPGAKESCNGIDDDCNGATDEEGATGCSPLYYDADGDGWGVAGKSKCLCHEQGKYRAPNEGDCDDDDPARNGGAEDVCNGKDDDCDGQTDEEGACAVRIGIDPAGGAGSGACGCACEDDLNLSIALALKDVLDADTLNASGGGSWKVTLSRGSTSENPSAADRLATFAAAKVERVLVIGSSAAAGSQCEAGQGDGASALVASFAGVHAMDLASRTLDAATSALGVADRGVVRAGAGGVVNGATVPAVRVEWGFATDPGDVAKIQSSGAPAALATALLHALQGHYGLSPFAP